MLLMNVSYANFKRMHGHIALLIIFELIADIKAPNTERNENVSEEINPKKGRRRIHDFAALAHGTLLAFWTAIDFKICYLIFSIFTDTNNQEYEIRRQMCNSFFDEMYFALQEFRRKFNSIHVLSMLNIPATGIDNEGYNVYEISNIVLNLRLDFILDTDKLDQITPDYERPGFINWSSIEMVRTKRRKSYKTLFPSVDYVRSRYKTSNITIEEMYHTLHTVVVTRMDSEVRNLVHHNLNKQLLQDSRNSRLQFWEIFYNGQYPSKRRIWSILIDEFTIDSQFERVHRISKAIEIMKEIRMSHYQILTKSFMDM